MNRCPRCGRAVPPGTSLCPGCGATVGAAGAAPRGTLVMTTAATAPRPKVTVRVVRADGGPENAYTMSADVLVCGKQADVSLKDDPFVSGQQTRFFFSAGRLAVEDVGGGNGTFVRLRQERELSPGGEVRVGRQRLLLEPIPALAAGAGGALAWGSNDPGYRLRLVQLLEGGGRGAAFPLKEGENALGREAGEITFPSDGFVSGRHALLSVRGERVALQDLGSSNGTFIRLSGAALVDSGDQFLIGRELVRVELS